MAVLMPRRLAASALALSLLALACATPSPAPAPAAKSAAAGGASAPVATVAPAPTAAPPERIKLTMIYGAVSANYLPLWVTADQGFLDREGIDVDLSYMDGAAGVRALAMGEAPLSAVGAALVPMRLAGADIVQIADI